MRRVRFLEPIFGVLMDDSSERVFVAGDEVDLSESEHERLMARWQGPRPFVHRLCLGESMDLSGKIVLCPKHRGLWRRPPGIKQIRTCWHCKPHEAGPRRDRRLTA